MKSAIRTQANVSVDATGEDIPMTTRSVLCVLIFLACAGVTASAGPGDVAKYQSGVLAAAGQAGAADPATQGWTANGVATPYSVAFDSGNGGWNITDGTASQPFFYQSNLSAADAASMKTLGWRAVWNVAVNHDALSGPGAGVDNYYTPSLQNNNVMWVELPGSGLFVVYHRQDSSGNMVISDGTNDYAVLDSGTPVPISEQIGAGSVSMDFVTFTLASDGTNAVLTDEFGNNYGAIATSGVGSVNRVIFGAYNSGGQGSTVWNSVLVAIPEPTTLAIIALCGGLTILRRRSRSDLRKVSVKTVNGVIAGLALTSLAASASWVSNTFDYKYEMGAAPSTFDLDSNSVTDFFPGNSGTAGDQVNNVTYAAGTGTFRDDNTGSNSSVLRTDFGSSLWRTNFAADTTWTAEARIKVLDDPSYPEGSAGTLVISGGIGGASPVVRLHKDQIDFSSGGSYVTYLSGTDFTTDFFDIAVARDAEGEGWLWVNNELIAQDQPPVTTLGGGHANGFFIGGESFSSAVNGTWEIDYLRLDTDFIQVPEPSAVALFALSALAVCRRRGN